MKATQFVILVDDTSMMIGTKEEIYSKLTYYGVLSTEQLSSLFQYGSVTANRAIYSFVELSNAVKSKMVDHYILSCNSHNEFHRITELLDHFADFYTCSDALSKIHILPPTYILLKQYDMLTDDITVLKAESNTQRKVQA